MSRWFINIICKEVLYVDGALLSRVCEYVCVRIAAVKLDVAVTGS